MDRKWIRRALQVDRRERWGLLFLIGSLAALYGIGSLFPTKNEIDPLPPDGVQGSIQGKLEKDESLTKLDPQRKEWKRVPFDPNQIEEGDWVEMGIPPKTAKTIRNYLSKGGRFRKPEDLQKIWGLKPSDYYRLMPYVRIKDSRINSAARVEYQKNSPRGRVFSSENTLNRKRKMIDLNLSDSVEWESLPGIGPGYARRIMRYRQRLGGFVRPEQVGETYQLPDSVFQKVRPYIANMSEHMVRQLNVNTVSADTLGRHPYCGYSAARLIVRYREQHGSFGRLEDLLDIQPLDLEWLERIRPYLKLE